MRSREFSSKTVEEAIASGLNELNLSLEEVTVDILEEGSKGFLGFIGARMARVRLTEKPPQDDYESLLDSVKAPEAAPRANVPVRSAEPVNRDGFHERKNAAPPPRPRPVKAADPARQVPPRETPNQQKPVPMREKPPAPTETPEKSFTPRVKKQFDRPAPPKPREKATPEVPAEMGAAGVFVIETAKRMDLNVEIRATTKDKTLRLDIMGDDKGILIGHRGETLDAIQYLASLVHNKDKEPYERIQLDSQNYRRKREDTLVHLANRLAEKARRTRHKVTLEPMNPYERRILHSALQNNPHVTTHSEGDEPNRRVVILPK